MRWTISQLQQCLLACCAAYVPAAVVLLYFGYAAVIPVAPLALFAIFFSNLLQVAAVVVLVLAILCGIQFQLGPRARSLFLLTTASLSLLQAILAGYLFAG